MARSSAIYLVVNASRSDEIFGVFTVQHEALAFAQKYDENLPDGDEYSNVVLQSPNGRYEPKQIWPKLKG